MREAEEVVKFVLRLNPKTHAKVKRGAKKNNTSMNKELANLIDAHYKKTSIEKSLDGIEAALNTLISRKKK